MVTEYINLRSSYGSYFKNIVHDGRDVMLVELETVDPIASTERNKSILSQYSAILSVLFC